MIIRNCTKCKQMFEGNTQMTLASPVFWRKLRAEGNHLRPYGQAKINKICCQGSTRWLSLIPELTD